MAPIVPGVVSVTAAAPSAFVAPFVITLAAGAYNLTTTAALAPENTVATPVAFTIEGAIQVTAVRFSTCIC